MVDILLFEPGFLGFAFKSGQSSHPKNLGSDYMV